MMYWKPAFVIILWISVVVKSEAGYTNSNMLTTLKPTFVRTKTNVTVEEGETATLCCTVKNLGTRQVSWRRHLSPHFLTIGTVTWVHDENIFIEHVEWPNTAVSEWNLVLKSARMTDTALYECQVIHTDTIKWPVHLTVTRQAIQPEAISITGKQYVESGETIHLVCNSTDGVRASVDVDWFKDGKKVDTEKFPCFHITKFMSRNARHLISELIIDHGRKSDSGTFICRSSQEQIASLDVTVLVAESSNIKRGSGFSKSGQSESSGPVTNNIQATRQVTLPLFVVITSVTVTSLLST